MKILAALAFSFLLYPFSAQSSDSGSPNVPEKTVWFYRVDTRSPQEVFSHGFSPKGNDTNLANHVRSLDKNLGGAAFVSVTDSYASALQFAENMMESMSENTIYIYQISAEPGFYDAIYSVRSHLQNLTSTGQIDNLPRYSKSLVNAIEDFSWEREWVVQGEIEPRSVRAAFIARSSATPTQASDTGGYSGYFLTVDSSSTLNRGFYSTNALGYTTALSIPIPLEDMESGSTPGSNRTLPNDTWAMPSTSGYVSAGMLGCTSVADMVDGLFQSSSDSNKRRRAASPVNSNIPKGICLGMKNLTKMRRNAIIISSIL